MPDLNTTDLLLARAAALVMALSAIPDDNQKAILIAEQFLEVEHNAQLHALEIFERKLGETLDAWKPKVGSN